MDKTAHNGSGISIMGKQDDARLLRQATIVSGMMLDLARGFHGDYRKKHVGAVWEELLVAFVLWQTDTAKKPMSALGIANYLGIPRSNVNRAILALIDQGLICKVRRRYARDPGFIAARPLSENFRAIRLTVIRAGRALQEVFPEA
jgi:DNA-binding MarR family transcriptional regulator